MLHAIERHKGRVIEGAIDRGPRSRTPLEAPAQDPLSPGAQERWGRPLLPSLAP